MKTAVITGGAGGLGRAFTAQLIAKGWHVVVLDLDVSGLDADNQLTAIQGDLTDASALSRAIAQILQDRPSVDLVIYNAGVTQIGAFLDATDEAHRRLFEINYFSAVALAQGLAEAVRKAKGTHLAISSVAGFTPLYHRTSYSASKHALEGFFSSLRSEESDFGVSTLIAAPSFVATNIGNDAPGADGMIRPGSASDGVDYMSPDMAADTILKGYEKRRAFIPVGRVAWLAWWIQSLSPRLFQRLMERNIKAP